MVTIYDVPINDLIDKAAVELKKLEEMKAPAWSIYVKTGISRERPPVNPDWWYVRAAAILRSVYNLGPIGVSKLRTKYGSKQDRGYQPEIFRKASGNIIRTILQQLEKAGLVKQIENSKRKGRIVTSKGMSFLDKVAATIKKPATKSLKSNTKETKAIKPKQAVADKKPEVDSKDDKPVKKDEKKAKE